MAGEVAGVVAGAGATIGAAGGVVAAGGNVAGGAAAAGSGAEAAGEPGGEGESPDHSDHHGDTSKSSTPLHAPTSTPLPRLSPTQLSRSSSTPLPGSSSALPSVLSSKSISGSPSSTVIPPSGTEIANWTVPSVAIDLDAIKNAGQLVLADIQAKYPARPSTPSSPPIITTSSSSMAQSSSPAAFEPVTIVSAILYARTADPGCDLRQPDPNRPAYCVQDLAPTGRPPPDSV